MAGPLGVGRMLRVGIGVGLLAELGLLPVLLQQLAERSASSWALAPPWVPVLLLPCAVLALLGWHTAKLAARSLLALTLVFGAAVLWVDRPQLPAAADSWLDDGLQELPERPF